MSFRFREDRREVDAVTAKVCLSLMTMEGGIVGDFTFESTNLLIVANIS